MSNVLPAARRHLRTAGLAVLLLLLALSGVSSPAAPMEDGSAASGGGLVFDCGAARLADLEPQLDALLAGLAIDQRYYRKQHSADGTILSLQTTFDAQPDNTLILHERLGVGVVDELVLLPPIRDARRGTPVLTVSRKEIALALMHPGRANRFAGADCTAQALTDHIGIRQNIVAWTEIVAWDWPDGRYARWNREYWHHGDLLRTSALRVAVEDAFLHQSRYSIGCYTATKLVVLQGVLDYYHRIRKDPVTLARVEAVLLRDGAPLTNLEPGSMWRFEEDATPADLARPGKLLALQEAVPAHNFIPGDWGYFLNTDPATYKKTGYEGSNAIYLGRGKFDDFYEDHHHYYTYAEKMHEVYQWRNHVFSARRDVAKVRPLSADDVERLSLPPERGGIELSVRAVPRLFGGADAPT